MHDWLDKMMPDPEKWAEQFAAHPVVSRPVVMPAGEPLNGPIAEEAALSEELAARAQQIASKINSGAIRHGLPPGYRFEFTRAKGPHPLDAAFTAQVRGTAPEPTPDGFLIPPGFAEDLRATVAELFGLRPDWLDSQSAVPPTRRERLRNRVSDWRERAARRAYKAIAGYWPADGEDW